MEKMFICSVLEDGTDAKVGNGNDVDDINGFVVPRNLEKVIPYLEGVCGGRCGGCGESEECVWCVVDEVIGNHSARNVRSREGKVGNGLGGTIGRENKVSKIGVQIGVHIPSVQLTDPGWVDAKEGEDERW